MFGFVGPEGPIAEYCLRCFVGFISANVPPLELVSEVQDFPTEIERPK